MSEELKDLYERQNETTLNYIHKMAERIRGEIGIDIKATKVIKLVNEKTGQAFYYEDEIKKGKGKC